MLMHQKFEAPYEIVDAKIDLQTQRTNTRFKRRGVPADFT